MRLKNICKGVDYCMQAFKQLGYDKQVTIYVRVPPEGKYSSETYKAVTINDCQVIINHKHNIKSNGAENADIINICFMCEDNPGITITDDMLNSALLVVGNEVLENPKECGDVYTLISFNYEPDLLPHYELGGR